MTGPEPGPYGSEGYNPAQQPQFGAPQYPPVPQPPQYPPAPQPPQYGQPPAGLPYGQPPAGAPYGQVPPAAPYGQVPPVPPYGQPPAPPFGQPTTPNRKPLIYGGIAGLVIIIAIIVTVVLVTGGGSGTPKGVLQDYLTAAKSGDVATAKSLTCDKYKDAVSASGSDGDLSDLAQIDFSVQDSHENGDTAVVNVKITYKANLPNAPAGTDISGSVVVPVQMVKEHGSWKVCMK